jgi:hypothetical protein
LKDKAFSTFLDQNPPFELPPKWNSAFDKNLSRSMARHRQHCHQATSERQIAVAPLGLIAVQSWNLWLIQILASPSISVGGRRHEKSHSAVSQGNVARGKVARCGAVARGLATPILAID